jgi:hypothetical protein
VDEVPCITKAHFEESMKYARRCAGRAADRRGQAGALGQGQPRWRRAGRRGRASRRRGGYRACRARKAANGLDAQLGWRSSWARTPGAGACRRSPALTVQATPPPRRAPPPSPPASFLACCRSVSDNDIRKYQAFAQTLQQSRGFGSDFRWAPCRCCWLCQRRLGAWRGAASTLPQGAWCAVRGADAAAPYEAGLPPLRPRRRPAGPHPTPPLLLLRRRFPDGPNAQPAAGGAAPAAGFASAAAADDDDDLYS